MSSYAPVYRPSTTQQSFLTREHKREGKRKRNDPNDSDEPDVPSDEDEHGAPRVLHPVNKTDPFYVAGHPREKPLPGGNFPHAAVKDSRQPQVSPEENLARLNPPIYVPKIAQTDHASSLRARHLDNLTAIMHKCMLKDDWDRASRAWGLILRTEVGGHGVDVRYNGRWTIGAEILMRRDQISHRLQPRRPSVTSASEHEEGTTVEDNALPRPVIHDDSFKKAQDYYDRLIVQYPHLQRTPRSVTSALSIQPARFSLWIYHVQDKSKRERQAISVSTDSRETELNTSPGSDRSDQSQMRRRIRQVRSQEHKEALEIARHLDELLVSPPYDTSHELLYTRGMVALWLYDMEMELSQMPFDVDRSGTSDDGEGDTLQEETTITHANAQRNRATRIFRRLLAAGMELPSSVLTFLDEYEGESDG